MERPLLNRRLAPFGTTIFTEMSARALATGSINLGQGFPDADGPASVAQRAMDAIGKGEGNQYPPLPGVPPLRHAVARHQQRFYGLSYDADTEVLVTVGATEAIASAIFALTEPGDEVIAFEPFYDSYAATIAMAGATLVGVTLRAPDFRPDLDGSRPRSPTGRACCSSTPRTIPPAWSSPPPRRGRSPTWPSTVTCSSSPMRSTST